MLTKEMSKRGERKCKNLIPRRVTISFLKRWTSYGGPETPGGRLRGGEKEGGGGSKAQGSTREGLPLN